MLRFADRVVVIHPRLAHVAIAKLGVRAERVEVIRNWTHLAPLAPIDQIAARDSLEWPAGVLLCLHSGNMGAKQGLENVVEAARLADERQVDVLFVLLGDGGERATLEARARGVKRIMFVDPLGDSDYRLALSAADILIVNEKVGVSAMAVPSKLTSYFDAGRPIVAAVSPGGITASELEAAEAAVVVPAGDPCALLEGVLTLASDSKAITQLAANGRRYRATVLDEQFALERWSTVVSEVARNRGRHLAH